MAPRARPASAVEATPPVKAKAAPTRAVLPDAKAQHRKRNREVQSLANDRRADLFASAPGRQQMAMTTPKRNATISSSALRQISDDSVATRRRRRNRAQTDKSWQSEAFDYAGKVGELGALLNLQANIVSLCSFPVRRWDPEQADWVANDPETKRVGDTSSKSTSNVEKAVTGPNDPKPVEPSKPKEQKYDDRPSNVMRAFVGPDGGTVDLIRRAAYNMFCAGDCTLLGTPHPKDQGILWEFLSVLELYPNAEGTYVRKRGGAGSAEEGLPADNFTGRLYRSDIGFSDLSDSEVKRVLPILQEIVTLTMMVDAIAKSRLAANMIFIPDELSFAGSDPQGDDPTDIENAEEVDADDMDDLVDELFDHMTAPVNDPGSAARLVPLVIRGKGEYGQYIKVIDLSRQLDMWAQELRQEALGRLANGLDAPPEAISGKGNVNHWTAANIDSEFIVKHIQPIGILIADFLTWAYLRPMLESFEEMSEEEALMFKVEFDPSPVIARADEAKSARDLSDWLSDDAILSANGFTKADMADDETVRVRRLWTLVSTQPGQFGKLITLIPGFTDVDVSLLGSTPPPAPPGTPAAPGATGAPGAPVGGDPNAAHPAANADGTKPANADQRQAEGTGKPAAPDGKVAPTGNQTPVTSNPGQASERSTALTVLVERLATAGDAAIGTALSKAGSRIISLSQSKAPELRERLRAAKKDRMMSLVRPSDLTEFGMSTAHLLRGAWDDLTPQVTSWVRTFLEDDGMEEMAAYDVASAASQAFVAHLDREANSKLLSSWRAGKNGLRVATEDVIGIIEQAAYAGAM